MPAPKGTTVSSVPDEDTDLRDDLEVEAPEPVEEEVEEAPSQETLIERQARELGWHPRDEYLGPANRWVDAETFIKRGNDILPVLRNNNKTLLHRTEQQTVEISELKKTLAEQGQVLKDLREMAKTANQRGYDRAISELKQQQRDAVVSGDTERFDKVTEQIAETERVRATVTAPAEPAAVVQQPAQSPDVAPEIKTFIRDNAWFNSDAILNQAMQNEHVLLRRTDPDLSLEENLAQAKATVMQRFPDRFPAKPNGATKPKAAPVAQPSSRVAPSANGRAKDATKIDSIEDLGERTAARLAFKRFQNQMPDYSEEEYMAAYNDPGVDIVRTRQEKRRAK